MRGGLRGFYVFIACIALGVMAIAGVGSVARSLARRVWRARAARILGGDVCLLADAARSKPAEHAFLDAHGRVSDAATMRAMARAENGRCALVELKAVDGRLSAAMAKSCWIRRCRLADALAERDGAFGAAVDPALLARLNLERGARVSIGAPHSNCAHDPQAEPDKLAGGIWVWPASS